MSRRKDQERFRHLKERNPSYVGFRGAETASANPAPALETVVCGVCRRKRNVASHSLPPDRSSYVCLSCQPEQETAAAGGSE